MLRDVRVRLAGMMFLLYFSLGSWAVTLSTYLSKPPDEGGLHFSPPQVGWTYSTFAFAGMLAPVAVGPLADRYFRADRVLAVSGLACAALLGLAAWWCEVRAPLIAAQYWLDPRDDGPVQGTFLGLFALLLAYCFFLQLTLTLSNVIVHRHHPAGGAGYSRMRMCGTIGWVVTGNLIGWLLEPISPQPFALAALVAGALGLFAFTLPATPPLSRESRLLPALRLFRQRSFCVFIFAAFLATVTNQFYGVYAHRTLTDLGVPRPERVLTAGQVVETLCMFVIPWLVPQRRLKALMLLGLAGWVVRGLVMSYGGLDAILYVGVPMHGWSFAFFFVVAQTYLKRAAPPQLAAGAQGVVSFVSAGLGAWVGNLIAGRVLEANRAGPAIDWAAVWVTPLAGCVLALVVFWLFFHAPDDEPHAHPHPSPR